MFFIAEAGSLCSVVHCCPVWQFRVYFWLAAAAFVISKCIIHHFLLLAADSWHSPHYPFLQ